MGWTGSVALVACSRGWNNDYHENKLRVNL